MINTSKIERVDISTNRAKDKDEKNCDNDPVRVAFRDSDIITRVKFDLAAFRKLVNVD